MKILVVDDEESITEILDELLSSEGYQVFTANNGEDAIRKLSEETQDGKTHLVVSDVRMPKKDGIELLGWIKSNRPEIKFILMTGFAAVLETKTAADLGCDLFYPKPFRNDEILEGIRSLLNHDSSIELLQTNNQIFDRVPIEDFISGKKISYPIYIKTGSGRFIKVAHQGEDIEISRIRQFRQKGVIEFWLAESDFKKYSEFSAQLTTAAVKSAIDLNRKNQLIRASGNVLTQTLSLFHFEPELMTLAHQYVQDTVDLVTRSEKVLSIIETHSTEKNSVFTHAVFCCSLGGVLGRVMGWSSSKNILSLALACFFHDIGLEEDEFELRSIPKSLMDSDVYEKYIEHPERSVQVLDSLGELITHEIKSAILDHHESCQGNGFPKGLSGGKIFPMAKIVAVVDDFSEYFMNATLEHRKQWKTVLKKMLDENPGKHDGKYIVALIALFSQSDLMSSARFYTHNELRAGEVINSLYH